MRKKDDPVLKLCYFEPVNLRRLGPQVDDSSYSSPYRKVESKEECNQH